jgi:hypothetical protein
MSSPLPKPPDGAFSIREVFPTVFSFLDRFDTAFKFLRTLKLVVAGAPLWDKTAEEIESLKILSSWKFNLLQSLFSAAVAASLVKAVGVFLAPKGWDSGILKSFSFSFLIPISLAAYALIAAYAVVLDAHLYRDVFNRCVRCYLYLDGAIGLMTQTIIASLAALILAYDRWGFAYRGSFLLATLVFFLAQGYVTQVLIPKRLFQISATVVQGGVTERWLRFQVFTIVTTGSAVQIFVVLISKVQAWVQMISLFVANGGTLFGAK